ncbi:MAG: type II toxin-antitoxin system YoeB family toxin [Oscillochloris sp.]|nr:type II toxin-antitoxin system YoeB family toxin [Oscillochloris sp.]
MPTPDQPPGQPTQRDAVFQPEFREDLRHWVETDRRTALKIFTLIEAILRDPFEGIGKPEPLKYRVRCESIGRRGSALDGTMLAAWTKAHPGGCDEHRHSCGAGTSAPLSAPRPTGGADQSPPGEPGGADPERRPAAAPR